MTCARCLLEAGRRDVVLLETRKSAGGVVQTDLLEFPSGSYLLDRGFQVVLDSYPSINRYYQIPQLRPQYFSSQALIWNGQGQHLHMFANPLKDPGRSLKMLSCGLMTKNDVAAFAALGAGLLATADDALFDPGSQTAHLSTAQYLERYGFSDKLVEGFFRPFFGGVLLDNDLQTAAPLFRYYLKKFILGRAFLPSAGVGTLPAQMWDELEQKVDLRLGTKATGLHVTRNGRDGTRRVEGIKTISTSGVGINGEEALERIKVVVLAVDEPAIAALLKEHAPDDDCSRYAPRPYRSVAAVYFWSEKPLYSERCLVLPAGRDRVVRHFCQLTNINRHLAPHGRCLLSATVLEPGDRDDATLFATAREEIAEVFPAAREMLQDLHITRIPQAVPHQPPPLHRLWKPQKLDGWDNVILAGHSTSHASLEGAMVSGERAARYVREILASSYS